MKAPQGLLYAIPETVAQAATLAAAWVVGRTAMDHASALVWFAGEGSYYGSVIGLKYFNGVGRHLP